MLHEGFYFRPIMSTGPDHSTGTTQVESTTTATGSGQSTATTSASSTSTSTSRYVVAEEYTVGVPLVRPKQCLLSFLRTMGATGEIFTRKEICQFLKQYIGTNNLYDPNDPRVVYCQGTQLSRVFGVDKFTIADVLELIGKNCYQVPDTCIKRKCHYVTRTVANNHSNLPQPAMCPVFSSDQASCSAASGSLKIEVCRASPIISSSTGPHTAAKSKKSPQTDNSGVAAPNPPSDGSTGGKIQQKGATKRKRKDTGGSSGSSDSKRRPASVSITYSDHDTEGAKYPWYFQVKMEATDDESEALSIQEKETARVQDSTDDLWFLDEDESVTVNSVAVDMESDSFSVEYEIESDDADDGNSTDSSSPFSGKDVLVVCNDSDVQFWADSSGTETDTELSDEDKWSCQECDTKNSPTQRYCSRCWKLRPGWLPDTEVPGANKRKESMTRQSSVSKRRIRALPGEVSSSDGEVLDSGIYTSCSSITPTCSQTANEKLEGVEVSGMKEIEQTDLCLPRKEVFSPKESPQAKFIGMRRTFLNYRSSSKDGSPQLEEKDKSISIEKSESFSNLEVTAEVLKEDSKEVNLHQSSDNDLERKLLNRKGKLSKSTQSKNSEQMNPTRTSMSQQPSPSDLCVICLCRQKTASIIHGSTGHQVCCFKCARRLKRQRKPCPVCRRSIQKVVKNFIL